MKQLFCLLILTAITVLSFGCSLTEQPAEPYPAMVRTNFVEACVATSGDRAYCECTLFGIEKEFNFDQYITIEGMMLEGYIHPKVQKIAASCG